MNLRLFFLLPALSLALSACEGIEAKPDYKDMKREKMYENGSVVSGKGGFDILGGEKKNAPDGLTVNAYLWRAALDTVSFMPLASADPFGGVILTDWYSAPGEGNERMKLNVLILDRTLRADGVRVKLFKQRREGAEWVDTAVAPSVASKLEETILTRAREMRAAQKTED